MIEPAMNGLIAELAIDAPDLIRLGELASMAARLDRAVLRALRLALPGPVDATAETDLWFSPLVARRTSSEIALHADALTALRSRLEPDSIQRAREAIASVRTGGSPLLALEEDLIALGVTSASEDAIQRRLGEALAAMREHKDRAADIAGWALRALPRLPEAVRKTAAAWSLAFAAEAQAGYAIELGTEPSGRDLLVGDDVPDTTIAVERDHDLLCLGAVDGPTLTVPATTPRVVVVETGHQRTIVTISPGGTRRIEVGSDDIVLTNLRGERWRARSAPAATPSEHAAETGIWVLVDGTDATAPTHLTALAEVLGRRLARKGYSLLVVGQDGLPHTAERTFTAALAERGYESGCYRLARVVPHNTRPLMGSWGRTLFPGPDESLVEAAARRADVVIAVGASRDTVADAAQAPRRRGARAIPIATLDEGDDQSGFVAQRPSSWTPATLHDFVAQTLDSLGAHFGVGAADPPPELDRMLHLAALALDPRDLKGFDERLASLRSEVLSNLPVELANRLIADPRRPSHRLLGYLRIIGNPDAPGIAPHTLLQQLDRELRAALLRWDTRTLAIALGEVPRASQAAEEPLARALAAACSSIEMQLAAAPLIDADGRARDRLREVRPHLQDHARSAALARLAAEYEQLGTLPADEQAQAKDGIFRHIATYARSPALPEADVWFGNGAPGTAIVALGLLCSEPHAGAAYIIEHAIRQPLSPFELTAALRVAYNSLHLLAAADLRGLRNAIARLRSGQLANIGNPVEELLSLSELALGQIVERLPRESMALLIDPLSRWPSPEMRHLESALSRIGYDVTWLLDKAARLDNVDDWIDVAQGIPDLAGTLLILFCGTTMRVGDKRMLILSEDAAMRLDELTAASALPTVVVVVGTGEHLSASPSTAPRPESLAPEQALAAKRAVFALSSPRDGDRAELVDAVAQALDDMSRSPGDMITIRQLDEWLEARSATGGNAILGRAKRTLELSDAGDLALGLAPPSR